MTATPSTGRILRALRHAWRMTNPWSPMFRDARGRPVYLYRLDKYGSRPSMAAELPGPIFARIRKRLVARSTYGMGGTPAVLLSIAAIQLVFFVLMMSNGLAARFLWPQLVLAIMFVAFAVTYRYRIPKLDRESIAAAILIERRCASCAYDLSATEPSPDGNTQCPECGAAWRLPGNA